MSVWNECESWATLLRAAAEEVRAQKEWLSQLDSHGGDGDHGTTMVRAMGCIEKAIAASNASDAAGLLSEVGWAVMGVDGGATGPLFGALFVGMAESAANTASGTDTAEIAGHFAAGLAGVRRYSRAAPGDKTMLDALIPAVEALGRSAEAGASVPQAFAEAAGAAESGADATKNMQARFGRAKNIGEKSIGNRDAGATSVALLFKGFAAAAAAIDSPAS